MRAEGRAAAPAGCSPWRPIRQTLFIDGLPINSYLGLRSPADRGRRPSRCASGRARPRIR
jgi:hypothetical protein